jgi:4-carboxymuconolactone decarboxylase
MTAPAPETRLTPIPFERWDDGMRATLLPHLRRPELYLSGKPDAPPMPVVMELLANHVPLSETFLTFTDVLAGEQATLAPKVRELVILRVAWRTGSGYEWHQHARMAIDAGMTEAQVRAVADGPEADAWSRPERALILAVDQIVDGYEVGEQTWGELAATFEPPQLLELLFVAAGYLALATVLNSIGLRGEPVP